MSKNQGQFDYSGQEILNQQKSSRSKDKSWYITITPFENGSSPISIFIKMFISIGTAYISLLYALLFLKPQLEHQNSIFGKIITLTKEHKQVQILLIVFSYILGIVSILIILCIHVKLGAYKSFLYSIIQPLAGILPLLPLLGTFLSSMGIISQSYFILKLISLIFTSSITIFIDTYLQCGSNSGDLLFSYNNFYLIISRYISSIYLIICAIQYHFQGTFIVHWVSLATFIIEMYYYCQKGFRSYRHHIPQMCLLINTAQFLSILISIFAIPYTNIHLFQPILIAVFLAIIISLITSKAQLNLISRQKFTIQQIKLFAETYNNNTEDGLQIQQTSLLKGLMSNHSYLCKNPACFSKKLNVFCPNSQASIESSLKGDNSKFDSLLHYFIKCLFQTLLQEQSSNSEIVLSYCEFLCYHMKILLPIHPHLQLLYSSKLNVDQQYRFYHLLKAIQKKLRHIIIGVKDPQLQKVIITQQLNDSLMQLINNYIRFNYRFWAYSQKQQQSKEKILQWAFKQSQMLRVINEKVEESKQYFNINKKLKKIYSFSQIFLNTDNKKQRNQAVLEKILFNSSEQALFTSFQKKSPQNKSINAFFGNNSVILITQFVQNQLIIRQMSKSSKNIIGFSQQQLVSCNLSIILPDYLSHHTDLFKKWTQYGQINHQKTLQQIDCYCRSKDNRLLSVKKSYKTYIDIERKIRFVCLLEITDIQPAILICPQKALANGQDVGLTNCYQYSQCLYDFLNRKEIKNHNEYLHKVLKKIKKMKLLKMNQQIVMNTQIQNQHYQLIISRIKQNSINTYYSINFIAASPSSYCKPETDSFNQNTLESKDHHLQKRSIFTKQQIYQPIQFTSQASTLNRIPCIFNLLIAILILISTLVSYNRYNELQIFIDRQVFIIRLQKHPYMLGINYYKAIMQIDDEQELDEVIQHYSEQFVQQISNQLFLLSYFDPQIIFDDQNVIIHRQNQLISYRSNDLIFMLASFASTFSHYNSQYDESQYEVFNQILLPFFTAMKKIKHSLFSKYDQLFVRIYQTNIVFLIILIILQIIVIIILILSFRQRKNKLETLLSIIVDHRQQQIIKIKCYWRNIIQFCQKTFLIINQEQSYDKNEQSTKAQIQIQNLQDNKSQNLSKAMTITIMSLFLQLTMVILTQYSSIYTANEIQNFQHQIEPILAFFPSGDVISYFILQKRYNQSVLNNSITNYDGFAVSLKQLQILKNIQYKSKASDPSSPFYQSFKDFFFDNPCKKSPKVYVEQGISDWQCLNFQQGKLASGLGVFNNYIFQRVTNYIESQQIMQNEQINGFTQSLTTMNAYLQQLIKIWMKECREKLSLAKFKLFFYNSLLIITLIIIYIVVIKVYLIPKLAAQQNLYKDVYRKFVTNEQISNSKIMQSQLRTLGFINNQ